MRKHSLLIMALMFLVTSAGCGGAQEQTTPPAETAPAAPVAPPAQSTGDLKEIQQQRAGDYTVTLLSDTGALKQGANNFILEFRRNNELADVGNVQVQSMMAMQGMGPMMATTNVSPSVAGRYTITADLAMAGPWKFTTTFADGQKAEFNVNTQ